MPPLCAPHYSQTSSSYTDEETSYHMMSNYQRANIFPGVSCTHKHMQCFFLCVVHKPQPKPDFISVHRVESHPCQHSVSTFTGPPVLWSSLVKDSYVRHPLPAFIRDPEHWHGHKTDDLGRLQDFNLFLINVLLCLNDIKSWLKDILIFKL